jgi:hypothetical protein
MSSDRQIKRLHKQHEEVKRRIDNAYFLVKFQEIKLEELKREIIEALGREDARTKFIDFDARREPKTNSWCVMCQKDLQDGYETVHVYLDEAAPYAVHPEDLDYVKSGILTINGEELGVQKIGKDCAKKLGSEWILKAAKRK